jgi:hypothetical protein
MHDKNKFLKVFENKAANISEACKSAGISRRTYYDWIDADQEFKDSVEEIIESQIDFAESMLRENIKQGKERSIEFFLKTQGKRRGYVERQEIQTDGFPDKIVIEVVANEDTDQ